MGPVNSLGYLGFAVSDINAWREFSENILGAMTHTKDDGSLELRIDNYSWRMKLIPAEKDDFLFTGWEVSDAQALAQLKSQLEQNGVAYESADQALLEERRVVDLIAFQDPDGNRCEAFYGPLQLTEAPFISPQGVDFKTGDQGLGHMVLITRDHDAMQDFYLRVMSFKLSDYINTEVVPGRPLSITFTRCNPRHHSLALAPVKVEGKIAHIMFEVNSIDDVGRAMYRAIDADIHLSFTLGRHSNDNMLSFYAMSPSGFDVEYGWNGLSVDEENWHVKTHQTNSAWGHTFQFPPKNN
jgi:2,3-dihydroxybiphenyl 1,2-dioxygenase